jgi:PKHD-type hydroxylase
MITYNPYDRHNTMWTWAYKHNAFSDEEIKKIISTAKKLPAEEAKVAGDKKSKHRESEVKWIHNTDNNLWILDRVAFEMETLNNQFYNFNLYGFNSLQFTSYSPGGYYKWHMDTILGPQTNPEPPRKLSATILLNDNYEGGQFEFYTGYTDKAETPELKKGSIVVFPSFMYHRVAPVTKGTRHSLVAWCLGPQFK